MMPKYDIGELIAALNEAVNKLNNLRVKYDDLEKERDMLKRDNEIMVGMINDMGTIVIKARAALGEKE
jgi:phosphatidylserine/phosphatidylglycerophosphate/cardiolipin synthase-like enzyme